VTPARASDGGGTDETDGREAVLYVDGASFGNPGPSGIGVVLVEDGDTVLTRSEDIGYGTNNQAEYRALLRGLNEAIERGVTRLLVRSDSQLLVRQMLGEYKVKSKALQALRREAEALKQRFEQIGFEHVGRDYNEIADELAKQGAEAAQARGVTGPKLQLFEE
jgi:ribonuclease HI/probable phosphoglycerate mutase